MADPTQVALDKLAKALAGSDFRAELRKNPKGAKGVNAKDLPPGLLETLGTMSDKDLQIVSRVQMQLNAEYRGTGTVTILF
jgi:hypothetical protein